MVLVLEKQRWSTGASSTSTVALSTASLSTSTKKPDAMHDFSPTIISEELEISYHFTSTAGKSLRPVMALGCQKSSDSNIQPNTMHDDAQSPGLLLVKKSRAAQGRRAERRKKVKEPKEKGLLLHSPLSR